MNLQTTDVNLKKKAINKLHELGSIKYTQEYMAQIKSRFLIKWEEAGFDLGRGYDTDTNRL